IEIETPLHFVPQMIRELFRAGTSVGTTFRLKSLRRTANDRAARHYAGDEDQSEANCDFCFRHLTASWIRFSVSASMFSGRSFSAPNCKARHTIAVAMASPSAGRIT